MAIKNENQQISVVLPKSIVKKLDILATYEIRTRSQQGAKIIIDYINKIDFSKIDPDMFPPKEND
jgi:metal-responsive CopG/Arc/MetJ family transcriptional regulator